MQLLLCDLDIDIAIAKIIPSLEPLPCDVRLNTHCFVHVLVDLFSVLV